MNFPADSLREVAGFSLCLLPSAVFLGTTNWTKQLVLRMADTVSAKDRGLVRRAAVCLEIVHSGEVNVAAGRICPDPSDISPPCSDCLC